MRDAADSCILYILLYILLLDNSCHAFLFMLYLWNIIYEVLLSKELIANERALMYGQRSLSNNAAIGDSWNDISVKMSRVIIITIMKEDALKMINKVYTAETVSDVLEIPVGQIHEWETTAAPRA